MPGTSCQNTRTGVWLGQYPVTSHQCVFEQHSSQRIRKKGKLSFLQQSAAFVCTATGMRSIANGVWIWFDIKPTDHAKEYGRAERSGADRAVCPSVCHCLMKQSSICRLIILSDKHSLWKMTCKRNRREVW